MFVVLIIYFWGRDSWKVKYIKDYKKKKYDKYRNDGDKLGVGVVKGV